MRELLQQKYHPNTPAHGEEQARNTSICLAQMSGNSIVLLWCVDPKRPVSMAFWHCCYLGSSMFSLRVRHARSIICVWASSDLVWFASVSTLLYHSCSDWFTAWWPKIQEWPEPVNNTAQVSAVGSVSSKAEVNSDLVSYGILGSSLLSLTRWL